MLWYQDCSAFDAALAKIGEGLIALCQRIGDSSDLGEILGASKTISPTTTALRQGVDAYPVAPLGSMRRVAMNVVPAMQSPMHTAAAALKPSACHQAIPSEPTLPAR